MLLQSHDGQVSLLPALPAAWANGSVKGIKARGNFTVDMIWKKGKLVQGKIVSVIGGVCKLRTNEPVKIIEVRSTDEHNANALQTMYGKPPYQKNENAKLAEVDTSKGYIISFKTEKGKTYTVIPL
jgi:alpha-L-fucosidase 2